MPRVLPLLLAFAAHAAPALAQPLPARAPRRPLVEVARMAVGADQVVERDGLLGRGAALCLVDTGVDASLDGLRDADDAPRVRWVWDAFGAARGTHPVVESDVRGALYGPEDVDAAPRDRHGHGTAMAAIAVGDGAPAGVEAGPTFGLAPAARIIAADAYDDALGGFPDEAVVRAVRLCRLVAETDSELDPGRLVILLSLGSHDGAHDGAGAFERAILRAAGSVPVVVAAGNDGGRGVHASGRVIGSTPEAVDVQIPRSARDDAGFTITVRHQARAPEAAFTVLGPAGDASPSLGSSSRGAVSLSGARIEVAPQPGESDTARLTIGAVDGALASGTYTLRFDGACAFDVWLADTRLGETFLRPELGGRHVRDAETIRIPATAPELIAVGASVARSAVTTMGGVRAQESDDDGVATFSSVGPTASGAPKPDLVAPGGWVLVPLSSAVRDGDPDNLVGGRVDELRAPDGRVAIRGSSVSAAVVAGALLLASERDPARLARARELLVASAAGDGWRPSSGWGLLDVPALLERWGGAAASRAQAAATRPYAPTDRGVWMTARAPGETLTVRLGRRRWDAPLLAGAAQLELDVGPRTPGETLTFEVTAGDARSTVEVPVVLAREEPAALDRGGCAAGGYPRGGAPLGWLTGTLLLAVLTRRRRGCRGSAGTSGPGRRARPRRPAARPCW